jgi:aspartate/methionine/tyrosine aminotransferase
VAQAGGVRVRLWHPAPDQHWQWDLDELKEMLSAKTRAVVINFPHNPTGAVTGLEFMQDLAALSQRHGFIVFSDEVYRGLEHQAMKTLPAFCDLDTRAVSLGVMSKAYGLPGLRLGWVASQNQGVLKTMAEFKDYTTICNPGPSEFLATVGLRNKSHIINRILKIISKNLKILDDFFERHNNLFQWQAPQAGPISFVRYKGNEGAEDFCHELAREKGVLLLPGSVYDDLYDDYFRIGFGRKNLPQAVAALEEWLLQRD